jgi:purine nucleosidase
MTEKILLDTDIGSDIDDAICLAYLLSQPKCQLLGITTVSGGCDGCGQLKIR